MRIKQKKSKEHSATHLTFCRDESEKAVSQKAEERCRSVRVETDSPVAVLRSQIRSTPSWQQSTHAIRRKTRLQAKRKGKLVSVLARA